MWFDAAELKRLDEPHEEAGAALLDVEVDQYISLDASARKNCPKCDDTVMMQFFFSPKRQVRVDHCPGCGGHWLDAGELQNVRGLYASEEERTADVQKMITEEFGPQIAIIEKKAADAEAATNPMRKMFSFIVPGLDH